LSRCVAGREGGLREAGGASRRRERRSLSAARTARRGFVCAAGVAGLMPTVVYPPGPPRSFRTLVIYGPGRDPLAFFGDLARTYGDISRVRMAGEQLFLLNHPHLVRDVLVTHQRNFLKGRGLERARRVLGQGLLTSECSL